MPSEVKEITDIRMGSDEPALGTPAPEVPPAAPAKPDDKPPDNDKTPPATPPPTSETDNSSKALALLSLHNK